METKNRYKALTFWLTLALLLGAVAADEVTIFSHTSTAELTPEWSPAGQSVDYTVRFCKTSGDAINEVRIYKNYDGSMLYTDFECDEKPGWELLFIESYPACFYVADVSSPDYDILDMEGECQEFTFTAHTPELDPDLILCDLMWKFETRDINDEWKFVYDLTSVDVLPPELSKELSGPSSGDCPPGEGQECWITQETEIDVFVEDKGRCEPPSGLDYCMITYRVDGGSPVIMAEEDLNGEQSWEYTVVFEEDSVHELTVECMDLAGNELIESETFKVDTEAPETEKAYGMPYYPSGINSGDMYPHYITTSSEISLTSEDGGEICAIGVDEIRYSAELASNEACAYEEACQALSEPEYMTYAGAFTIPEESCHIIQYYSVDALGNEEMVKVQCVYVDDSAPDMSLEMDGPSLECSGGEGCGYWVQDHGTEMKMLCEDMPEDHPVNNDMLCYTISLDGMDVTGEYCSMFGGGIEDGFCCVQADEYTFTFQEDSIHELEFYCEDALGNMPEENYYEVFKVDSQPPGIEKTLDGPSLGICPPQEEGDECWIKDWQDCNGTTIHVEATDDETYGCASDQVTCSWWYVLDDSEPSQKVFEGNVFDIRFMEDTVHELHIECCDILENCAEDIETFYVDSTPPETGKTYSGPYMADPGCVAYYEDMCGMDMECVEENVHRDCPQWISLETEVLLESADGPDEPCASEVKEINYAVSVVDNSYCEEPGELCMPLSEVDYTKVAGDTVMFSPSEESCHLIQYYAVDRVGNIEDEKAQCVYVDDTAPLGLKEVGEPKIACEAANGVASCAGTPMEDSCRYYSEEECNAIEGCEWNPILPSMSALNSGYCSGMPVSCAAVEAWTTDPEDACMWTDGCTWQYPGMDSDCWWVRDHVTQITLSCADVGLHPVENERLCYRIGWDGTDPWLTEEYCTEYGGGLENGWCCADVSEGDYMFDFTEDSAHELEYYCMDALGNMDEVDSETFKVDSIPPTTTKEYVGPFHIADGVEWIDTATKVMLSADDGGAVCHVDGVETYYQYSLVDDKFCLEPETYCKPMRECAGWSCLDGLAKEFFTTGRYGQNNPTGAWELAIWDASPSEEVVAQDDFVFPNNQTVEFSLSYDASTGEVTYSVGGESLQWNAGMGLDLDYIIPFAKGNANGNYVELTGMELNGEAIPDVDSGAQYKGLRVPLMTESFTLTGNAKLVWDTTPKDEIPGFHVFVMQDVSWMVYEEAFGIDEESCHMIQYYSVDALGNEEIAGYQCAFVDKTAPCVWKAFEGPYFADEAEWINSQTRIKMYAEDSGPHPSGLDTIEYRITLVEEENCMNQTICMETEGAGSWTLYDDETDVMIPEESCHMIEIRAKDNVWKTGNHKQCVYVDNSAPEPNKTVGEPKTEWDGRDSIFYPEIGDMCWAQGGIDCWKLTLTTPVSLSCVDPQPHPVDHEVVCFNIEVDAEDHTGEYCEMYAGQYNESSGFCCLGHEIDEFYFLEETEHNLEYYCVDALGNTGPVDEEKFKVEGRDFEIQLNKKWNLISVPFMLLNDDIGEVFKGLEEEVDSVWTYDAEHQICGQDWCVYTPDGNPGNDNLHKMLPGWGYWVAVKNETKLLIGGSEMMPVVTPPSRMLYSGWNLIGYHGLDGQDGYYGPFGNGEMAYCALYTLRNTMSFNPMATKWSSLITYWEPYNPHQWMDYGVEDYLDPGAGYWVFMEEDDVYARSTACSIWITAR